MFGSLDERLDWETDGRAWPNRELSRFVRLGRVEWHLQEAGPKDAPLLLLIHGTGASTHSFRDLLPVLAEDYRVMALDLPGHGFSKTTDDRLLSLPGMAQSVGALLAHLEAEPVGGIGHSAGAAVLLEMTADGTIKPKHLFGLNAALKPMQANAVFSPLAKMLFLNPFVPRLFSMRARMVDSAGQILSMTGSKIDAAGIDCYAKLFRNPAHVAGALGMMANWELEPLQERLATIETPITLIVAEDDPMVPPSVSRQAADRAPQGALVEIAEGGHLVHEVAPEAVARLVRDRLPPSEDTRMD